MSTASQRLLVLRRGPVSVAVDPRAGGRIVSFAHEGRELLTTRDIHPNNYGSTFWDSPQTAWGWPPRACLDSEPYAGGEEDAVVRLTSAIDASGLQFSKRLQFDETSGALEIAYTIHNRGREPQRCAPWEITRVPGGLSFFPAASGVGLPASALEPVSEREGVCWYNFDPALLAEGRKLFAAAAEPWLAHVSRDGLLFVKRFPQVPQSALPPGQGEVELWGQDGAIYVELETHGAYRLLEPGASLDYVVHWWLEPLPAHVRAEPGNATLVAHARGVAAR